MVRGIVTDKAAALQYRVSAVRNVSISNGFVEPRNAASLPAIDTAFKETWSSSEASRHPHVLVYGADRVVHRNLFRLFRQIHERSTVTRWQFSPWQCVTIMPCTYREANK